MPSKVLNVKKRKIKIKRKMERNASEETGSNESDFETNLTYENQLYPVLSDPLFSYRIGKRREFYENSYIDYIEGQITEQSFKEKSDILCNLPFSLAPHQRFVKNFMSFNTPYNSLLLFHGLGTGKTCSAMGICEEMRNYMKKVGSTQRIIIIASPNVQDNFKSQLFDKNKLKKINGKWNLESCVGSNLINEITQNVTQTFKRDVLIRNVERLIRRYYMFTGYQEFSNFFNKKILQSLDTAAITEVQKQQIIENRIRTFFGNRLVVVDEAHNLRPSNKKEKGVGNVITQIVEKTRNMRLLLLSATPMYNSPEEIIWLTNLMCKNDNIPTLEIKEVFDRGGHLKRVEDDNGDVVEIGARKLAQKLSGHISFVRGENPFTFPFSLYPGDFRPENSVRALREYPELMFNGKDIVQPLEYLDCFMTEAGDWQKEVYGEILDELSRDMEGENRLDDMEGFGYNFIQPLLDSLIICFPSDGDGVDGVNDGSGSGSGSNRDVYMNYTGKSGLEGVVDFKKKSGYSVDFSYKPTILEKYGRIFSKKEIGRYSGKIKAILESIENSDGIVMIYSQFLDGSLIPMALALEEEGYRRTTVANGSNFFSDKEQAGIKGGRGNYAFISGNQGYSPNNVKELERIVSDENKDGNEIKVVLISRAGSEGLDFKNVRQLHILEPWYNTKRIEQIIGRGVRNCSHKSLPFEKRNVSIYLHATNPFVKRGDKFEEPADLYVYRYAERGAVKIGVITRLIKETSIDCLINHHMLDFSTDKLNLNVNILLPSKNKITYRVGDKPYSSVCDYMEKCSYVCKKGNCDKYDDKVIKEITEMKTDNRDADGENGELLEPSFYENDVSNIINKISDLYLEDYAFSLDRIHRRLKGYAGKQYSYIQIVAALNKMIENENIKVMDNFGRYGYLIKIGDVYFFNPMEMKSIPNTYFEIKTPVEFKHEKLVLKQEKKKKMSVRRLRPDVSHESAEGAVDVDAERSRKIKLLIDEARGHLDTAFGNPEKIKNDKDWYRLCAFTIPELIRLENIAVGVIEQSVIQHYIDFNVNSKKKRELIEFLYSGETETFRAELNTREKNIFGVIEKYINHALVMQHAGDKQIKIVGLFDDSFVFNYYKIGDGGKLELAKPEDINDFKTTIINFKKRIISKLSEYVGFASVFKQDKLSFKVKQTTKKRSKGARCDQAGKSSSIALVKEFRDASIDGASDTDTVSKTLSKMISQTVCVYQEILLRSYDHRNHKGKTWFLPLEHYKQSNIENITL